MSDTRVPTARFRWLVRKRPVWAANPDVTEEYRVLQQWHGHPGGLGGDWIDVPTEREKPAAPDSEPPEPGKWNLPARKGFPPAAPAEPTPADGAAWVAGAPGWDDTKQRVVSPAAPADAQPVATILEDGYWTHLPGKDPFDRHRNGPIRMDVYSADALAALRAERDEVRRALDTLSRMPTANMERAKRAEAELAQAREDAERWREQFQRETLRTSEYAVLLDRWMVRGTTFGCTHEPWPKACDTCRLMVDTKRLRETPINIDAARGSGHE